MNPTDEPSSELPADVHAALQRGSKIDAIKQLRAARGVDLRTAKQTIDGYLGTHPDLARRFQHPGGGLRALIVFVLLVTLLAAAVYFLFKS